MFLFLSRLRRLSRTSCALFLALLGDDFVSNPSFKTKKEPFRIPFLSYDGFAFQSKTSCFLLSGRLRRLSRTSCALFLALLGDDFVSNPSFKIKKEPFRIPFFELRWIRTIDPRLKRALLYLLS